MEYKGEQKNVLGFAGSDAEGIPWQLFFDSSTKRPIYGISGDGDPTEAGSTILELSLDSYKPLNMFSGEAARESTASEFLPAECLHDYEFEGVAQPVMPTGDFGLFAM